MKTTFIVLATCAILYIVSAIPLRSDEELARDAVSRILQSAKALERTAEVQQGRKTTAEEDSFDGLARKLARAAASSENAAEIQFWNSLMNAAKKAAPYVLNAAGNAAKDILLSQLQPKIQGGEEKAEEQHSFHFYEKEAARQDQDEEAKEQHSAALSENAAEIQFWSSISKSLLNAAGNAARNLILSKLQPKIQGGEEKAEEQHSFHFYEKEAAKQDGDKVSATVQEGEKKAKEQHSFHFYDEIAAIEKLPAKLKARLLQRLRGKNVGY